MTGLVLDSRSATSFSGGQYFTWAVSGRVLIRVTLTGGPNAVNSALFLTRGADEQCRTVGDVDEPGGRCELYRAGEHRADGQRQRRGRLDYPGEVFRGRDAGRQQHVRAVRGDVVECRRRQLYADGDRDRQRWDHHHLRPRSCHGCAARHQFIHIGHVPGDRYNDPRQLERGVRQRGVSLANDATSLPAYTTVTQQGSLPWTWAASR